VARGADALSVARLFMAVVLPLTLVRGAAGSGTRWIPLMLVAAAATTDFLDGILARRAGNPWRYGTVLDNAADIALVATAAGAAAWLGLVPWAAPVAMLAAFSAYALASARRRVRQRWAPARSRLGHLAGVLNYALAGLAAGAVALPDDGWAFPLEVASLVVIGVNLAAVVDRMVPRRAPAGSTLSAPTTRSLPGGGSTVRSARSSPER
jgi:phosphatidylglycerophosphate synthase